MKTKSTVVKPGSNRLSFGKLPKIVDVPNLIDVQVQSYDPFLQRDILPDKRSPEMGLEAVFRSTFPITSQNEEIILDYVSYSLGSPKYDEYTCREKGITFSSPLKCVLRIIYKETGEVREKEIFMGDIPMMTPRGTFIINGAERVVVSQIHKSPGVVFSYDGRKQSFAAKIIPDKGAWLEFELDTKKELLYVKIDRKKRILVSTLLRAIGYEHTSDVLKQFYKIEKLDLDENNEYINSIIKDIRLAEDIHEHPHGEAHKQEYENADILFAAGSELIPQDIERLRDLNYESIKVISKEQYKYNKIVVNCIDKDEVKDKFDAISKIHSITRPGEPTTYENALEEFNKLFFDGKRYDLGKVGRYKFNQKLYDKKAPATLTLTPEDILRTLKYLLNVYDGTEKVDDIDHLGNRRIRSVGELFLNQLKVGFARMERAVKERMNSEDVDEITPQKLVSIKPITAVIKEFFGSSQLSQFMDQTNPLSELTHKRRLNALGPGGLSRDRAGFEVRDLHHTHYGRMCPIETPEGPNIGLILSLSTYAKINEYGFLVTPYRKVKEGVVSSEIEYLTAIEEEKYFIAQANAQLDDKNRFVKNLIPARNKGEFPLVPPENIDFMDVSPKQIISVSTSLIPFLEHDDANRALMGSNMQRQAVPLLMAESPLVGTGMEAKAAMDSGVCLLAKRGGEVIKVSNTEIHIKVDEDDDDIPVDIYKLLKFKRTNQNTCFNQRPRVKVGDMVEQGDLLADGPSTDHGELALGKNILVAFMSWEGYNFEDAIILSERLLKDDIFTSIHIDELEIEARETKLGSEKITADIPNLSEEAFRNLDEEGIIRVGSIVSPGDILVGKVTPKGETDLTPEYKLLHSIFGEKAREVKDTSLRASYPGTVIDVKIFSRDNEDDLPPGVEKVVKVYIAQKRKVREGDKLAGRHGNKGIVSTIVPEEDMPFTPDGTPIDIILNPLGVPSRMNLGQIFETTLGWIAQHLGTTVETPVFEGATIEEINTNLENLGLPVSGKVQLYDGKTGLPYENEITVGQIYMLKLNHMVDDKLHARSTGPYSLVTQQPLGGKAQFGGQRLGEMEVWALEAYGASNILQEFLTVKSDDMTGRAKIYESIVKGEYSATPGVPESFNVLVQEIRGLGLDIKLFDEYNQQIGLTDKDWETINKLNLINSLGDAGNPKDN